MQAAGIHHLELTLLFLVLLVAGLTTLAWIRRTSFAGACDAAYRFNVAEVAAERKRHHGFETQGPSEFDVNHSTSRFD